MCVCVWVGCLPPWCRACVCVWVVYLHGVERVCVGVVYLDGVGHVRVWVVYLDGVGRVCGLVGVWVWSTSMV